MKIGLKSFSSDQAAAIRIFLASLVLLPISLRQVRKIKKEDIIIYWIDDLQRPGSELNKIEVDDNGDVNFWPEGIFTESLEEVKGMRRAQREK